MFLFPFTPDCFDCSFADADSSNALVDTYLRGFGLNRSSSCSRGSRTFLNAFVCTLLAS